MAYTLAFLAAASFALGSVLQQKGTLETRALEGDPRFLAEILRRPVWLAGGVCQMLGWILQAVALDRGSLIVVQSITTLSLVLALPLGRRLTNQSVTSRTWLGASGVVVGIVLFLAVGSPEGGIENPSMSTWWRAIVATLVIIGFVVLVARNRRGAMRALLFGSAAGVCFALQASVTKVFVTIVGSGLSSILHSWTVYVLVGSAVIGFALQQSALKTGVLAPAMASSNAVTLFVSVIFGVVIFEEKLFATSAGSVAAIAGLAIALLGIGVLAGAGAPRTHRDASGAADRTSPVD